MSLAASAGVEIAVIPVAGLGTRMLPASKAIPKEMLPIMDKPMIQMVAEEAVRAGIRHIIFVTHMAKTAIENHFDRNPELEDVLAEKGKQALLQSVKDVLPAGVTFSAVRQGAALGLGHAIACARALVDGRSFAVLLPDVLIDCSGEDEDLGRMIRRHLETGAGQIMVTPVPRERVQDYGTVALSREEEGDEDDGALITGIVEKAPAAEAPSNLAVVGRYVFSAQIFPALEALEPGVGGEMQLTDAIARQLQDEPLHAYLMQGQTFDCGSKLGWLEANLHFGLKHPECGKGLHALMARLCGENDAS
ncbi:MAG: UTP--glucose-1-phosphate uridylyltransferase [Alcanivoracaceae bacterium]|jgi:UTP--glucose-1-phosphate uridylyltransferase|nr:UTP--glucose-1-phosphate uridylyltransferase [Alcanivoracaceae bacterium]